MIGDLRFAIRTLAGDRRFAIVVIATLAIGVAVNTTAFTLLNSLALRGLPAPGRDRLVRIYPIDASGLRQNLFSYPDYLDYRSQATAFDGLAAYVPVEVTLANQLPSGADGRRDQPEATLAYVVSSGYFAILGMQPAAGRAFVQEEDQPEAPRVAVISDRLWKRCFNRDHKAVGARIDVNGRLFTIVGIAPAEFIGTEPLVPEIWLSLSAHDVVFPGADLLDARGRGWLLMVGRLKGGVSRSAAAAELTAMARRLAAAHPSPSRPTAVAVARATFFSIESRLWPIIFTVMTVACLVLLIACANVANLTLARAASRQRELAIRLAIGATRARIMRLLAMEGVAVGAAGAAAGLLLSSWLLRLLYPVGVALIPFPSAAVLLDLSPDIRVFTFTAALAAVAGIAIGLAPALQFSSPRIAPALQEDGAVIGSLLTPSRVRQALVVFQIAACVMLLAGAGLLTRAVHRAKTLDLGFDARNVVMTSSHMRQQGYTKARVADFNERLEARAATLPGWRASAYTSHVPLTGGLRLTSIEPDAPVADGSVLRVTAPLRVVTATYFDVLRMSIVAGRTFLADELAGHSVVILSETLARRFWPSQSPLGRTIRTSAFPTPATIVGVVRDTSASTVWQGKEMAIYYPVQPSTDARDLHLIVRVDGDSNAAAAALGREARVIDPALRFEAAPLEQAVRLWLIPARVAAAAARILGVVALTLAGLGLYAVLAYTVTHRTREIGIRMALGAAAGDVLRLIVRDGTRLIAVGLGAGLIGALLSTRVLRGLLLDVSPFDPLTLAAVSLVLSGVGLAASYLPARRAARLNPVEALRR